MAPSWWPLIYYLSFPLGALLHRNTCPRVCSAHPVSGFNKWKNKNRRLNLPLSRASGSERIHWQGDGILSLPTSVLIACWKCRHLPFKPYSQLAPASLLILCPEVITMTTCVLAGAGPSMPLPRAQPCLVLTLQVPGQTRTPGAISSRHIMWSFKWFLCLSMGVISVVYFSEKES